MEIKAERSVKVLKGQENTVKKKANYLKSQ